MCIAPLDSAARRMPVRLSESSRFILRAAAYFRVGCSATSSTPRVSERGLFVGSVIKKRRKRMAKKKHRKLLKKTRVQRRKLGK
jgi:hypothetical protein